MNILGIIGIAIAAYVLGCNRGQVLSKDIDEGGNPNLQRWITLGVFIAAFAVRFWQFGVIPYGINQDEAMAAVDAKALAEYATDRFGMYMPVHFTAWGYGQMSVLLSYSMIPFIKLLGFNAVAIRLPMLIFSMLGLVAVYRIARMAFGKRVAFCVLAICAINPWHFMQSRWSLDCNLFPHVLALGIMFLLMGVEQMKKRYLCISMLFFALCMYCYGIALYTVPFFLVIMCIYLLRKKLIDWTRAMLCVGVYIFFAWPFYMTMAINTFKWETIGTPFFTIPYFPDSVRSKDILFFSDNPLMQLWTNIKATGSVFVESRYLTCNYVTGYAPIYLFFLPFGILGIVLLASMLKEKNDEGAEENGRTANRTSQVAVLIYLLTGLMAGILTNSVNVNRINIIFYPVLILCGLGIAYVIDSLKRLSLVLVPIVLIMIVGFFGAYFGRYTQDYKALCFTDFIQAVAYLGQTDCTYYVITPDSQYRGSYNVSEIMTLYAQEVDARYFQNLYSDEKGLYYSDKYIYARAQEIAIDPATNAGFVVTNEEIGCFDAEQFDLYDFGRYIVAIPR